MGAKHTLLSILIIVLLTSGVFAEEFSITLQGSKAAIYPEVGFFSTTVERVIIVGNPSNQTANVTLIPEEEYEDMIKFVDGDFFIIESGQEERINYEIKVKEAGTYDVRFNVVSNPSDGGSGFVLPVSIMVIAKDKGDSDEEDPDTTDTEDNSDTETNTPSTTQDNQETNSDSSDVESDNQDTGDEEFKPLLWRALSNIQKPSTPVLALGLSTAALIALLAVLLYMLNQKKKKRKQKRIKTKKVKRGRRSS